MSNPNQPKTIALVIDDEPQIRRLLRVTLEANGYDVVEAAAGTDGLVQAAQCRANVILLDLGLPDMDGLQVLKRLREWSRVPVLILSVRDREQEKAEALDAGADDYVTKPFGTAELLARLRVALRHSEKKDEEPIFRSGPLVVDLADRHVTVDGKEISLTATEYNLLRLLVRHAGKVLTHRFLLREIWGPNAENQNHYLRVYIARLREKLKTGPGQPDILLTESGIGYRLADAN
jgi:two-component system, OmpR family, KDP operon response regulator KdpE